MNLLVATNEIFLIEIIVAVVEIIGVVILFALLAYIIARSKKLIDNDAAGNGESSGNPEIRYVYVSSPPPEGAVITSAPAPNAPPAEPEPEPEPEYEPESEPEQSVSDEEDDEEESDEEEGDTEVEVRTEGQYAHYFYTRYNRSMTARLAMGTGDAKKYYSDLKNVLLSYDGVKSRLSWKWDAFRFGKKTLARVRFNGKSMAVCLALSPQQFLDDKYSVKDLSEVATYVDTPTMFRVKTPRQLKNVSEVIDMMMKAEGIKKLKNAQTVNYAADFPPENRESLIQRSQIRVSTKEEIRELPPEQQT